VLERRIRLPGRDLDPGAGILECRDQTLAQADLLDIGTAAAGRQEKGDKRQAA
jgi:hypothetical protein